MGLHLSPSITLPTGHSRARGHWPALPPGLCLQLRLSGATSHQPAELTSSNESRAEWQGSFYGLWLGNETPHKLGIKLGSA